MFQGCGGNKDGFQRIEGTNACHWIKKNQVPLGKTATYNRSVADMQPEKEERCREQFTAGGNILNYTGETSTETASIETAKLLVNSTVSTKGARFMAMDISNFYIHNDLIDYQYIRCAMSEIPKEIIDEYNLETIVNEDGYCYIEIRKVLYGLQEAGYVTHFKLKRILGLEGYVPSKFTQGLFTHKIREIVFYLVVENFGVRYKKREDAEHLLNTKQGRYPVKAEWDPTFYLGVTLEFDYDKRTCKMSMLGYVEQALIKFYHEFSKTAHSPSPYNQPVYSQKI